MKAKAWSSHLICGILAAAVAFGGAGCLVSGFRVENASLWQVALWCAVLAGGGIAALRYRKMPFLLGALLIAAFLLRHELLSSVLALVWRVSDAYCRAYGWNRVGTYGGDLTLALCLISTLSQLLVLTALYRGSGIWAAVTVSVLPLAGCLVVTDAVPGEIYLFLLLLGLILLVMSQELRGREAGQAVALIRYLALPVGLFLLVLFLLFPRDTYALQSGAEKLESFVTALVEQAKQIEVPEEPPSLSDILPTSQALSSRVNLETVGKQSRSTKPVMDVTLVSSGTLYLRGCAYAEYTGTRWLTGGQDADGEIWASQAVLRYSGTVTIRTRTVHDVLYIPYYSGSALSWKTENSQHLKEYAMETYLLPGGYLSGSFGSYESSMAPYLELPPQTRQQAELLVTQILQEGVPVEQDAQLPEKINKIVQYVKNSADYDLNTERMPQGEEDFALWFLTESDTGYCIHFATAATVLLRAAGIPARYVTGYMAAGQAGQTVTVTESNAHAWVEYRLPGLGWMPLEATPGSSSGDAEDTQPVQEPTQPRQDTEEPSQPETKPDPGTPGETVSVPAETPAAVKLDFRWVWALLLPLLPVGAVVGQWKLRLYLRKRKQLRGSTNDRALALWQEYVLLNRLLKQKPSKQVRALAQKAKFSQYAITEQELEEISMEIDTLRSRLMEKPLPQRLAYRLVFAAY